MNRCDEPHLRSENDRLRGEVDEDPRPITPYRLSLSRPISSGADVPQTVPEASEVSPIQEPESEEPMVVDAEAAAEAEKWRRCGHPTASSPTPSAKGSMFEAQGAGGGSRIVPEQPLPGGRTAFQPSGLSNNPFALAKADAPLPQKDIRKGGPSAPSHYMNSHVAQQGIIHGQPQDEAGGPWYGRQEASFQEAPRDYNKKHA